MKILIVDDDDIALDMLGESLTEAGHEVEAVTSGHQALAVLDREPIQMVITDWTMPHMSGLELCKVIRERRMGAYVYVIMLTAHDDPEAVVEGLSVGADDFITKPFNPAELHLRIRAGERVLAIETRDVAIFAMAKLAESRDPETGSHLERVQHYCLALTGWLAEHGHPEYQMDADYRRTIYLTSPLHDIGKIAIPDSVLLKPDNFNDDEFEVMKRHTMLGAETLRAAVRRYPDATFLNMAEEIARTHHERFDGSGYPAGLSGHEIPLSGRIVALADVYDALASRRVYKEAFSHELAKSIIQEEAGRQFDPEIVKAFRGSEDAFIEIMRHFGTDDPTTVDTLAGVSTEAMLISLRC
ncbi:MAG: response regulator [Phycisphaerales bacterium]|nr:MAG: response regulator [Phycisphaerales bacterium]